MFIDILKSPEYLFLPNIITSELNKDGIKICINKINQDINSLEDVSEEELVSRTGNIAESFFNLINLTHLSQRDNCELNIKVNKRDILLYASNPSVIDYFNNAKYGIDIPTHFLDDEHIELMVDTIHERLKYLIKKSYKNIALNQINVNKDKTNIFIYDINKPSEKFVLTSGDKQIYKKIISFVKGWIKSAAERPYAKDLKYLHMHLIDYGNKKEIRISYESTDFNSAMILSLDASALTKEEYKKLVIELYNKVGNGLSIECGALDKDSVIGNNKLDIFKKFGVKCSASDFAVILGVRPVYNGTLEKRTFSWYTASPYDYEGEKAAAVSSDGELYGVGAEVSEVGIRPTICLDDISFVVRDKCLYNDYGVKEITFGEYPQTVVSEDYSKQLEHVYLNNWMKETGKSYYIKDSWYSTYEEYEYEGKKYIRVPGKSLSAGYTLSDGRAVKINEPYWIEVEPIVWLVDEKSNLAITKNILLGSFSISRNAIIPSEFKKSDLYKYINEYFAKSIFSDLKMNTMNEDLEKNDDDKIFKGVEDKEISEVTIPEGIEEIGDLAFYNCNNLKRVKLPKSLRRIGRSAFEGCSSLKKIILPSNVEIIDNGAFLNCTNLISVLLPNNLKVIGASAFENCQSLKSIKLPNSVEKIRPFAFCSCFGLEYLLMPKNYNEDIGKNIFTNCPNIEIVIPVNSHLNLNYMIDRLDFDEFFNKKIVFYYDDLNVLNAFLNNNKSFLLLVFNYLKKNNLKNIKMVGPEIPPLMKINLTLYYSVVLNCFDFEEIDSSNKNKYEYNEDYFISVSDEKIEKKIKDIYELSKYLPDQYRESIRKKVQDLVDDYDDKVEKLEPKFGNLYKEITLSLDNVKFVKSSLDDSLDVLAKELAFCTEYNNIIIKINNYINIVNNGGKVVDDKGELSAIINSILNNIACFDLKRQNALKSALLDYFNTMLVKIDEDIKAILDDNVFTSPTTFNYNQEMILYLGNLNMAIEKESNEFGKYTQLLSILKTENNEFSLGDGIDDLIGSIRYIISCLTEPSFRNSFSIELNNILKKYIQILNKKTSDSGFVVASNYKEFEGKVYNDLLVLLVKINNRDYSKEVKELQKDDYVANRYEEFYLTLKECKELLEKDQIIIAKEEHHPILKVIVPILEKFLNKYDIRPDARYEMKERLLNIFKYYIDLLEGKLKNEENKYDRELYYNDLNDLIDKLADLELEIDFYINDENTYEIYI